MKKIISMVIVLVLLLGIGITNVQAASCRISASANKSSVQVGDTVIVTISFSTPIGAASPVTLNYDSSVLKYNGQSGANQATNTGSAINFYYIDASWSNKTISRISVEFIAKAEGTARCSIAGGAQISDVTSDKLTPTIGSSASITVKNKTNTNTNTNTNSNSNNNDTKDPTFRSVNQTVYATSEVNVRKSWSTSSAQLGRLQKGDSLKRTGIGSNGWSRVTYNGQTAYINSSYLTTKKPSDDDNKNNTTTNEIANETTNNQVNNTVTNNEITNAVGNNEVNNAQNGENINNEQKDDTPQTGENQIDSMLYIIIAIIAIAIIIIIIVSIRESKHNRKNRRK